MVIKLYVYAVLNVQILKQANLHRNIHSGTAINMQVQNISIYEIYLKYKYTNCNFNASFQIYRFLTFNLYKTYFTDQEELQSKNVNFYFIILNTVIIQVLRNSSILTPDIGRHGGK